MTAKSRDFGGGCARPVQSAKFLPASGPRHRDQGVSGARSAYGAFYTSLADLTEQVAEFIFEVIFEPLDLRGSWRIGEKKAFHQAHGSEWGAVSEQRRAVAYQDEFDAAAADIDQQIWASFESERMTGGAEDQACFFGTGYDADREAGFPTQTFDEEVAIAGLANGTGSDRADAIDLADARQVYEMADGANRQVHRFRPQPTGSKRAAAKANGFLYAIDDVEMSTGSDIRDHHVNRIRSNIDRGKTHGR